MSFFHFVIERFGRVFLRCSPYFDDEIRDRNCGFGDVLALFVGN